MKARALLLLIVFGVLCTIAVPALTGAFNYGAIDIAVQDQHTEIVDLYVSRLVNTATLINATAMNDTTVYIEISSGVPVVGQILCLKETYAFYQGGILSVTLIAGNQYTIVLDTPLDFAFTVVGGCSVRSINLAVDGSVTPIEFIVSPANLTNGTAWDITRIIIHIVGTAAMDDGLFGDQVALLNGVVYRTVNGTTKNIFNAKTNGDYAERAYDREYASKAPAGKTSLSIRRSFNGNDKNGVTLRLNADTEDQFVIIIQDDLTGLDHMHTVLQGHVVLP